MRLLFSIVAALLMATPTSAQPFAPAAASSTPDLTARVNGLVLLFNGGGDFDNYFAPVFRAAITRAQLQHLIAQYSGLYGKATAIERVEPSSPWLAAVRIAYERGTVTVLIAIDPKPPHQATGLRITGSDPKNDSLSKLDQDFSKLAGTSGYGIYALDTDAPTPIHEVNGERTAPLGSAFKLWVLAEVARQVATGERRWSDVVPVGPPSLPSGVLQTWPAGTPMTLQALATLMISISDNTAADTLLTTLGRDKVDAMVATLGTANPARAIPVLTTHEMFAIKSARADIALAWPDASPEGRRKLLADNRMTLAATLINGEAFRNGPIFSETVEWFASPRDEARTLDWLRLHGGDTTLAILAVSPGIQESIKANFAYLGFKGGSEPGVIALNYLVRTKAGRWFAVTANWHRSDSDVEAITFSALVDRALRLAERQ